MTAEQIATIIEHRAFPCPGREAQLVETHISWVILTEACVYKIKKPIHYSFLDFSTPERRGHFCRREYQLNTRLTSGMYLGVLPVRQSPAGPVIGDGPGAVIDYALWMRRMDEGRQMDRLLRQGAVTRHHMWQLARRLAAFHREAAIVPGGEQAGDLRDKFADLLSVRTDIDKLLGPAAVTRIDSLTAAAGRFLRTHAGRLHRRNQLGWAVDGHGDLHSRNILLLHEPVIFDCIEFNDDLRRLDRLNEVAFFCMDLDYYGHDYLAGAFLRDYLNRAPCLETEADYRLFLFYKLYRANVRLKVNCLRTRQPESDEHLRSTTRAVSDYYNLLNRYADALAL